ncbi:MAG: hypothetical protein KGZ63_08670 [Clostridiales bacterium]|jgi:hypothetical protein|nr:hypothetical protein [Clostridiales bacterium]
MSKVKIKDFYVAGLVFGALGGIIHNLLLLILITAGLRTSTYWKDMANVFFNPPAQFTLPAQIFGLIASIFMAGLNGVLIAVLLKVTGRDYLYIKSISMSSALGFVVFMIVYPAMNGLQFLQNSVNTNYVALFTFIFYGAVVGFMFDRFSEFETEI